MLKQLVVFCGILIAFFATANAGTGSVQQPVTDTSDIIKKDTLRNTPEADPKQGFKDLFVSTDGNASAAAQLNPLAISFVEDYIEKFGKSMEDMKGWGKPYFDMMDAILEQHGLPKELKYLAVIESNLKPTVRSWAGAVGPWQFMPATGRNMGLKIGRKVDERMDFYKSTHAASRYLTSLFAMYGDWLLVIAAYNGGPGNVNAAIRKSGSHDFWSLQNFLPAESRKHVKKFIATHYIMEGEGGITTLTKNEVADWISGASNGTIPSEAILNAKTQSITGRYNAAVITKHITMELAAFKKINPNFDNEIASKGKYELRLPADKMEIFLIKKTAILDESIQALLNPDYQLQTSANRP